MKILWNSCNGLNPPFYLNPDDNCFYHEEYFIGRYDCSSGNQLVSNFKIPLSCKGSYRWTYKVDAIKRFANLLKSTNFPKDCYFIPAPTSKRRDSVYFDSRLDDVIKLYKNLQQDANISFNFDANYDEDPCHTVSGKSRNPSELSSNINFTPFPGDVVPAKIIIIDDMITTGGHYTAFKNKILLQYPNAIIAGFFLAKRIYSEPPENNYNE